MSMRKIEDMEGFRMGCTVVNNLRYVDATVILAKSEEPLQCLINVVILRVAMLFYPPYDVLGAGLLSRSFFSYCCLHI